MHCNNNIIIMNMVANISSNTTIVPDDKLGLVDLHELEAVFVVIVVHLLKVLQDKAYSKSNWGEPERAPCKYNVRGVSL